MTENRGMPDDEARGHEPSEGGRAALEVGLGVAAVARRLGVAPGTLRTWDRRYGVGPTGHVAGSHRRYTSADLGRLAVMRRLMLAGVSPAQAAVAALDAEPTPVDEPLRPPVLRGRTGRVGRAGGGRVVPLRDASPAARGLARAAMALDASACSAAIGSSLSRRGVVPTWQELVLPVLAGLGERWRASGRGVEVEHLLSECVEDGLRAVTRRLSRPLNARPVLLAAVESEDHHLPLHALAAALAERHVGVRMLGPRLPVPALVEAVGRTGAVAVFVWSQGASGEPVRPAALAALSSVRPAPALLLGGPGWPPDELPAQAERLTSLGAAVDTVLAVVGVHRPDPR